MSAGPSELSATAKAKSRHRLNPEGNKILHEYWNEHPGEMPSLEVRKELTEAIKRIPGNEFYKIINTSGFFKRRVDEYKRLASFNDPRFPSLSPNAQEHLRVLLNGQPNPSPGVIETWASLLAQANTGATHRDVEAWVHLHMRGQADPQQPLPTPANTVSPEPSNAKPAFNPGPMSPTQPSSSTSPTKLQHVHVKKSPTQSPMLLPPLSIQTSPSEAYSSQHTPCYQPQLATPTSPSMSGPAIRTPLRPRVSTLQEAIIQGVADAIASPALTSPSDALPSNAAEFNAMFASFEKQLSQLKHALESS